MTGGPFGGFASAVWSALRAPWLPALLAAVWLAGAVVGLVSTPGTHPADSVLLHLPAAILPFALWARHASGIGAMASLGLGLALLGVELSGPAAGTVEVGAGVPAEAYQVPMAGRGVDVALGGQLTGQVDADGHVALRLGTPRHEIGAARLPLDRGHEATLGPWRLHLHAVETGDAPTLLRGFARRPAGERVEVALRLGQSMPLPDGATLTLDALDADYGKRLGAAARVTVDAVGSRRTDWVFLDAPDLDARLVPDAWSVEPTAIVSEPIFVFGVRRAGLGGVALVGLALLALALLARLRSLRT